MISKLLSLMFMISIFRLILVYGMLIKKNVFYNIYFSELLKKHQFI